MSKQLHRCVLQGAQTEQARLERYLAHAFVNTTSAIGSRPEPSHRFANAARDQDDPTRTRPWEKFADPLRDVAVVAVSKGDAVARQTEDLIVDAVIALLDYVTEPFQKHAGVVSYLAVAREVPEAIDWLARARMQPSAEIEARAERESAEACAALTLHRGTLRRPKDFPRPRGATPIGIA
jgi:hypothetical protein